MITEKKLKRFSKEELIQFCLLRNDDAKDYSKVLTSNLENINKIVNMALDTRNAEVKQTIEEWVYSQKCWTMGHILKEDLKELLQKLGLEDGE